jgi:uracil-DNA glycosylase
MQEEDLNKLGIHSSWHGDLFPFFKDSRMAELLNIYNSCTSYPSRFEVFRAFSMPKDQVKVVLIGMDPYPTEGDANGWAFSVNPGRPIPLSLRVIMREIFNEYQVPQTTEFDTTLSHWIKQGVLLLNSSLSVEKGKAGSHSKYWKFFMEGIVSIISMDINPTWLLIGNQAKDLKKKIMYTDKTNFKIVERSHPAAERYKLKFNGFTEEIFNFEKICWI